MKRRWLLILVPGILAVVLLAVITFLLASETGLRLVAGRVSALLPEGSTLGTVHGRLIGPFGASGVRVVTGGAIIAVDEARFDWQPRELLRGRLRIGEASAQGIDVQLLPRPGTAGTTEVPELVLPLAVIVERLELGGLSLRTSTEASPIIVERIAASGRLDDAGLRVSNLRVRGPQVTVEGAIAWPGRLDEPLDTTLGWRLDLPDLAPLAGRLKLRGTAARLELTHVLDAPYESTLEAVVSDVLASPQLEGTLQLEAIDVAAIRAGWPQISVRAELGLQATPQAADLDTDATVSLPDGATLGLRAQVTATPERLEVRSLRAQLEGQPGTLTASGSVTAPSPFAFQDPELALDIGWREVAVALGESLELASTEGSARLTGRLRAYQFDARADVAVGGVAGTWALNGDGSDEVITIAQAGGELLGGRIDGSGRVAFAAGQFEVQLDAQRLDPAVLVPGWNGTLNASAGVAGGWANGLAVQVALNALDGNLRGYPIRGGGTVRYAPQALGVDALTLAVGNATLEASGQLLSSNDFRWTLNVPALGDLLPGASGRVASEGRLAGTREALVVRASASAKELSWSELEIGNAEASAALSLAGDRAVDVTLRATELARGAQRIDEVTANATGTLDLHTLELAIASARGSLEALLDGGLADTRWSGRLLRLDSALPDAETWTLQSPAALSVSPAAATLEQACLGAEAGRLCVGGSWSATEPWRAELSLQDLPLARLALYLPPGLDYQGRIDGQISLSGEGGSFGGEGTLGVSAGRIVQRDPVLALLDWDGASATVSLSEARLQAEARFELSDAGGLDFQGVLPLRDFQPDRNAPLDVRVQGSVKDFPLLAVLVPDLSELKGQTQIDLGLEGTLEHPLVFGTATLTEGSAGLPELGITLQDATLELTAQRSRLELSGSLRSGDGKLELAGNFEPTPTAWRGSATLSGKDLLIIDTPELRGEVSPQIELALDGREVNVSGEVIVPRARLEPRDLTSSVQVSPDQVLVGKRGAEQEQDRWRVSARIRLEVGEEVQFKGFGLEGRIEGSVLAVERPDQVTTGAGELRVEEGTYKAYGQELTIERGRLLFAGTPIANPNLDVRATRESENVRVGVDVRGTLLRPELNVFSDPALPQSDALSYLILGRPVSGLQSSEQAVLNSAASRLGLAGAGLLAEQVGRRIGLDASIESGSDPDEASLVIGTYLSPKLYVSYGLGLFETLNSLRLRYEITPNISLQTESGAEQGADLIYSIEK